MCWRAFESMGALDRPCLALRRTGCGGDAAAVVTDEDDEVRNWATLGLDRLSELSTRENREALRARLSDSLIDVRREVESTLV